MPSTRVLALGLDTLEASLVERLIADGRMPNLAGLRARGATAEVRSPPAAFLNSWMVWPSFFTGRSLGAHGWHTHKPWNARGQHLEHPDPARLPIRPFWDDLPEGFRLALIDVPHAFDPGPAFPGVFVGGWHGPDDFGRPVRPAALRRELVRRHGRPITGPEIFGPQSIETLEHQRREAFDGLRQLTELALDVLGREPWDVFLAVLGGAHRANHYLWPPLDVDLSGLPAERARALDGARDALYVATDEAVGRLLAAAPADVRVLVFALHGMGPNPGWGELFGRIAGHLRAEGREVPPREGIVYRIKRALPTKAVGRLTRRLPASLTRRLIPLWSRRMHDWESTAWFALPSDLHGHVRVNLRGREMQGVVEPGAEYEALLERLTEQFVELEDLRDGRPVVVGVDRVDDLVGRDAPRRAELPDLVVRFTERSARGSPGLRSRFGELRLDPEAAFPSGRTGNHTASGWCVATGPGIAPGSLDGSIDAIDLTATVLAWAGAPLPTGMEGAPVEPLSAGAHGPTDRTP